MADSGEFRKCCFQVSEACAQSPIPAELRILPSPLQLAVGDRIHRTNGEAHVSELVVEAYDEAGVFLPSVPIIVDLIELQKRGRIALRLGLLRGDASGGG